MVDYKDVRLSIAIPTAEYGRRADFQDHIDQVQIPDGIGLIMKTSPHGQSPARNRNLSIEFAKLNNCTHILFIDDDVLVPPDVISKLLRHDVDMVTGLYLMRSFPHQPIIFDKQNNSKQVLWLHLNPGLSGLIKVVSGGLGCCLIKMSVFEKLTKPYIRLGEVELDHWCDDIGFFHRTADAGLELYCDLDVQCGHINSMVVKPVYLDGKWFTTYDTSGTATVTVPGFYEDAHRDNKELELTSS